jgi:hypothetical protein
VNTRNTFEREEIYQPVKSDLKKCIVPGVKTRFSHAAGVWGPTIAPALGVSEQAYIPPTTTKKSGLPKQ